MHLIRSLDIFDNQLSEPDILPGLRAQVMKIQPGMAVGLYSGDGYRKSQVTILIDNGYVHFSCLLQGTVEGRVRGNIITLSVGKGYIGFAPGERLSIQSCPNYRYVELMILPECLAELVGDQFEQIAGDIKRGFVMCESTLSHQTIEVASRLAKRLDQNFSKPLFVHAAALEFLAWRFSDLNQDSQDEKIPLRERKQLLIAQERLLQDLSAPPTIAELARETGLNQLKLKRGFKTLFGTSIYAMFQQYRMERAKLLLRSQNVTETATTLGYSNISHFSAAFRKQFGILPSDMRKGVFG